MQPKIKTFDILHYSFVDPLLKAMHAKHPDYEFEFVENQGPYPSGQISGAQKLDYDGTLIAQGREGLEEVGIAEYTFLDEDYFGLVIGKEREIRKLANSLVAILEFWEELPPYILN